MNGLNCSANELILNFLQQWQFPLAFYQTWAGTHHKMVNDLLPIIFISTTDLFTALKGITVFVHSLGERRVRAWKHSTGEFDQDSLQGLFPSFHQMPSQAIVTPDSPPTSTPTTTKNSVSPWSVLHENVFFTTSLDFYAQVVSYF